MNEVMKIASTLVGKRLRQIMYDIESGERVINQIHRITNVDDLGGGTIRLKTSVRNHTSALLIHDTDRDTNIEAFANGHPYYNYFTNTTMYILPK